MTNVQRFHLAKFRGACEYLSDGNVDICLELCFELRQEPELATLTKGLVSICLATACNIDSDPEMMEYAQEGLRCANALLEEEGKTKRNLKLEVSAKDAMKKVDRDQEDALAWGKRYQEKLTLKCKKANTKRTQEETTSDKARGSSLAGSADLAAKQSRSREEGENRSDEGLSGAAEGKPE